MRRPPRSTLLPYTTLFRSRIAGIPHRRLTVEEIADLLARQGLVLQQAAGQRLKLVLLLGEDAAGIVYPGPHGGAQDRTSTPPNSRHANISYALFFLKKKKK